MSHSYNNLRATAISARIISMMLFLIVFVIDSNALDPKKNLNQYSYRRWGVGNGMPHPSVRDIIQSQQGYIWVATEFGLSRFNGYNFISLTPYTSPALEKPYLNCMAADSDGTLWTGSQGGGLIQFSLSTLRSYGTNEGLAHIGVYALLQARNGSLWIGSANGVSIMRNRKILTTPHPILPRNTVVYSIAEDIRGRIWLGTSKGLYGPVSESDTNAPLYSQIPQNTVNALLPDPGGGLWVGTDQRLFYVLNSKVATFSKADGLRDNKVLSLYRDKNNILWIGTSLGISRIRGDTILREQPIPVLDFVSVNKFMEDVEGNLWVASNEGLFCLQDVEFGTIGAREGLYLDEVLTVSEGAKGSIWIGTSANGLYELKSGKLRSLSLKLSSRTITSVIEDRENRLWAGSRQNGVDCVSNELVTNISLNQGLSDKNVTSLYEGRQGQIWVGTGNGLNRIYGNRAVPYLLKSGTNQPNVRCILETKDQTLWVGASDGIFRVTPQSTNHFTEADGLSQNLVFSLMEDTQGRLWAGTANGLSCWVENRWRPLTNYFHKVFWMAEDDFGSIWYSTALTIFKIKISDIEKSWKNLRFVPPIHKFDSTDGLIETECIGGRQPVGSKAADGRLWFITRRGLAIANPNNPIINTNPPPIRIESMLANGRSMPLADRIELPAGTRQVEFRYAALSYSAPERVLFRHFLEGIDENWTSPDNNRTATYANLKPGQYTFKVTACNNHGVWNPTEATLTFSITPYFYETTWFYGAAIVAALSSIVAAHLYRIQNLKKQRQLLEDLVKQRTRKLEQQMAECISLEQKLLQSKKMEAVGQLTAGVAHHFNNLLMIIQGYSSMLHDQAGNPDEIRASVETIANASDRAVKLIQQLLSFSRKQGMRLQPLNLNELVQKQAAAQQSEFGSSLRWNLSLDPKPLHVNGDADLLIQVFQGLFDNARDAMPSGGIITVATKMDTVSEEQAKADPELSAGPYCAVSITDTGRGIAPDLLPRIFEPFFTTKDVGQGTGLNMAAIYGIVKQHHGWIAVRSIQGMGTTVEIKLPANHGRHSS